MAKRIIAKEGDEILTKKAKPVTVFDDKLSKLIDDMFETMDFAQGAGLAAVQVSVLRRVFVMDVDGFRRELVNPEIIKENGEQNGTEGCLSAPGEFGMVRRPNEVTIKAQDRSGTWHIYKGEGLKARCFCHETDHLNGILFKQKASRMLTAEELEQKRQN
jgi:peptide deformylase